MVTSLGSKWAAGTPPINLLSAICHFRASGESNCTVFSTVESFWSNTDSPGFVLLAQFRCALALLIENDELMRLSGRQ
jgi:hypothetical protein